MKAYCGGSIACPMDRGPQIFLYAKAERDTQRKREKERGASEERGTFSMHTQDSTRSHRRCVLLSTARFLHLRVPPSSSSQSRPGDYERCDMRARYYEGAVGRATTCISGSRCVTRLIKIPRDLLRWALVARSRRGGRGRERRVDERERERDRDIERERKREKSSKREREKKRRKNERKRSMSGHTRKRSVGGRKSARHTLRLR